MEANQLKDLNVSETIDARGTPCPGPLLEAKRGIVKVAKGEIVEILSSDEGTNDDIPLWCNKVGHEYLGKIEEAGYWKLFVKRNK